MTILIVDDNEQNLYLLQTILHSNGYQVVTAANGVEALDKARQDPPNLIVSDILMPVMDGFALCREWKMDKRLRQIPFVFYTATYTDNRDREFALSLGAEKFLVKPVEAEVFIRTIQEAIQQVKRSPAVLAGVPVKEPQKNEAGYLKQYNEVLIRKLEDKMQQLEQANRELERDIAERKKSEQTILEANERFNIVARATNDTVWDWDLATNSLWWNDGIYAVFGYRHDMIEPTIESWYNRIHPEDKERTVAGIHAVIDGGGQLWSGEYRFLKSDRSYVYVFDRGFVMRDGAGKAVRMIGAMLDITERKKAEEALHFSEERYKVLFEGVKDAIFVADPETRALIDCNKRAEELTGRTREEILSMRADQLHPEDAVKEIMEIFKRQVAGEEMIGESFVLAKDGRRIPVSINTAVINLEGKRHVVGVFRNATDSRKMEEQMRAAALQMGYLTKYANDFIILLDENFRFIETNERVSDHYGYSKKELLGMYATELRAPEVRAEFDEQVKLAKTANRAVYETIHQRKDGTKFPVEISLRAFDVEGKRRYQAIIRDITERKKAEEELHKEKDLAQKYLDTASVIMLVIDTDGKVTLINEKGSEVLGYPKEEIIGKDWFDNFVPKKVREEVKTVLYRCVHGESGLFDYLENPIVTASGEERLIAWRNTILEDEYSKVISILSSGEDITERKAAEKEMAKRVHDLEIFQKATIDRETRMIEQKKRIQELEGELKKLKNGK